MSRKIKIGLLAKIVIAIVLGIVCGLFFPEWLQRIFATFNGLFSNFLGFFVPLAGFILWAVLNDTQPKNAKKAGIGAIIGVVASVVGVVLLYVLYFAIFLFIGSGLSF